MKILWVNPSFLDYRIPVYKRINELAGKDFFLIYSKKRVSNRVISKIETAIGENAIGLSNEILLDIPRTGDFANTDIKIPYQPGLYKTISDVTFDIIIGEGFFQWTPIALLNAKFKRKQFLLAYERTAHTERNCPKWRTLYRKIISKFVSGYLVNGKLSGEYLLTLGIKKNKIFLGGMSADSDNLVRQVNAFSISEQESLKLDMGITTGLTFLYVGQITERKGVILLLTAWKKHIIKFPNDNLLIIGRGELYEQYIKSFSSVTSIKLMGNIDYDLIHRFYSIADVFIIPTLEDNWSLVVPEAMACGLPVACSIYNGCYPELVHQTNGKLFNPLKESEIIATLEYFHDRNLKEMGNYSRQIEKQYSADFVAQNIFNTCRFLYTQKKYSK